MKYMLLELWRRECGSRLTAFVSGWYWTEGAGQSDVVQSRSGYHNNDYHHHHHQQQRAQKKAKEDCVEGVGIVSVNGGETGSDIKIILITWQYVKRMASS